MGEQFYGAHANRDLSLCLLLNQSMLQPLMPPRRYSGSGDSLEKYSVHCSTLPSSIATINLQSHSLKMTTIMLAPSTSTFVIISFVSVSTMALLELSTALLMIWLPIPLQRPYPASRQNTLLQNLDYAPFKGECW